MIKKKKNLRKELENCWRLLFEIFLSSRTLTVLFTSLFISLISLFLIKTDQFPRIKFKKNMLSIECTVLIYSAIL